MMPAVESIPFAFLLVVFAKPILFAINYDAVPFEICPGPCHFGARTTPFGKPNSNICLEDIVTTGASSGKGRGPRGSELIDLSSEGQNLGIHRINFAPISIDFHVVKLCPGHGNNSMWLNLAIGSSARLNVIHHSLNILNSLNECIECGVGPIKRASKRSHL